MSTEVNPFDGLRNATVFETGAYFEPNATYDVEIERVIVKPNRNNTKLFFIAETRVLTSSTDKVPVGSKRSWMQDMRADGGFGELKKFVYAMLGKSFPQDKQEIEEKIDPVIETMLKNAIGPTQPLKGKRVHLDTVGKTTVKKGLPFTQHNFSPYKSA